VCIRISLQGEQSSLGKLLCPDDLAHRRSYGAIMDIGIWLRSLALEQYEAAFRENEIEETILPSLTAADLKDLGVRIVGHRWKLLNAIATLGVGANATEAQPESHAKSDRSALDTAERRQVTVKFAHLVGSTALAASMDPEDLREVIDAPP
jgi:hypothetical protein